MPKLTTDDGVQLYYEEAGAGTPVVFVHEFGGDHRSWEHQVRYFSRRYRCIAFNARGYPPSDVPEDFERYSQARARDDIRAVLEALKIDKAHVVGLSMGAFATLHFGMAYPSRALSITVAGGGYGSHPAQYRQFQVDSKKNADVIRSQGMKHFVATYGHGPQRVQLEAKDPRGFAEYVRQFEEHSPLGAANTLLGVQNRRPSFYDLTAEMARVTVPTLIMSGDEEEPCLEVNLLMKRTIPTAALAILPRSGHAINLEEPALFNQLVEGFFHQVEAGRWGPRDPRSTVPSIYGPPGKP
jgi:pimeloyl-ACP methyl ester carboxylesterase